MAQKYTYRGYEIIGPDPHQHRLSFANGRSTVHSWYVKEPTGHLIPCDGQGRAHGYVDHLLMYARYGRRS